MQIKERKSCLFQKKTNVSNKKIKVFILFTAKYLLSFAFILFYFQNFKQILIKNFPIVRHICFTLHTTDYNS